MTDRLTKTFPVSFSLSPEGTDILIDVGGGIRLKAVSPERLEANGDAVLHIPYKRVDENAV
jgi:hypothetical protein